MQMCLGVQQRYAEKNHKTINPKTTASLAYVRATHAEVTKIQAG